MTTYYQDVLKKLDKNFLDVNPAYEDKILSKFGHLDVSDMAVNEKYIQFEALMKASNIMWSDELGYIAGSSKYVPTIRKAKFVYWGVNVKEADFLALEAGHSPTQQKLAAEIQSHESRLRKELVDWCVGYTGTGATTSKFADLDWIYPMKLKAATGTPTDPADICSTPGTVEALTAVNLTGTNKSVDFVKKTFGALIELFMAQRDTTTGETMLKHDGTDTYTALCNPILIHDLQTIHPTDGTNDQLGVTYMDQINKLNIEVLPSYNVDAAYASAEDGTVECVMVANIKENFKIGWVKPYTVDPWRRVETDSLTSFKRRGWAKLVAFARPYYIGGLWNKAMAHMQFTYMNDAG